MRYISFSPYFSGLSNIIMSYEIFLSIAHITRRKVILPPDVWMLFHSKDYNIKDWKKKDYVDLWEIFDKDVIIKEFDCIDFYDVPEFQGKFERLESERSYTGNISNVFNSRELISLEFKASDHILFTGENYSDKSWICSNCNVTHTEDPDFFDFCQGRESINLNNYGHKFLHFEKNLFGHYWYDVYAGTSTERNELKNKINRCFRYENKLYDLSDRVKEKIGDYNSVHIRRNDFLDVRPESNESISDSGKIIDRFYTFFETSKPLYIATDEKDLSFFDGVREKYDIYFYSDFDFDLTSLERDVMDQVICSNSTLFFGTYMSTYTKRINVMRGLDGKQADDDIWINLLIESKDRVDVGFINPWKLNNDKRWHWHQSSHPQWKYERNGKYVNQSNLLVLSTHYDPECQPPRFNKVPFKKIKLHDKLYSDLYDEYSDMNFDTKLSEVNYHPEYGRCVGGTSNIKTEPYLMKDEISEDFRKKGYDILTPIMEEWTGIELTPSWAYGIRSYPDGSVLGLHRDRINTHVLSCIIYVDKKSSRNWALDFYDHEYNHHEVFFEKGDVLLYESLCVHGRQTPFEGEYYRNMYFHWRPSVWEEQIIHQKYSNLRLTFKNEKDLLKYYSKA